MSFAICPFLTQKEVVKLHCLSAVCVGGSSLQTLVQAKATRSIDNNRVELKVCVCVRERERERERERTLANWSLERPSPNDPSPDLI
jgi:hypothetical protein